jgi:GMP synthase (glutamine-hydrolysing)
VRALIIQHDDDTPLGTLEPPLVDRGWELEQWMPRRDPVRPSVRDYDAVIALGGITNPDQDEVERWLPGEVSVLAKALEHGVPTLGICLGGQLLARAAGGRVGPVDEPEIGWYPVELTDEGRADEVLGGLGDEFEAFQWHLYGFELPPEAVLLASTPRANQAFRLGEAAWGLQFHIEVDERIAGDWLALGGEAARRSGSDPDAIAARSRQRMPDYVAAARRFAERFAEAAEQARRSDEAPAAAAAP